MTRPFKQDNIKYIWNSFSFCGFKHNWNNYNKIYFQYIQTFISLLDHIYIYITQLNITIFINITNDINNNVFDISFTNHKWSSYWNWNKFHKWSGYWNQNEFHKWYDPSVHISYFSNNPFYKFHFLIYYWNNNKPILYNPVIDAFQ